MKCANLLRGCVVVAALAGAVAAVYGSAPSPSPATAPAVKVPLTPDDIKDLVDQGKYPQAIAGISRLLDPSHPADFDRTAMLMLRAECTLQLKQATNAINLLDSIRKLSHQNAARQDESKAAALIFLIHKSPSLLYTPKIAAVKTPIDILNRDTRELAYKDLYDDELAVSKQTAKEAAFGTSLTPIVKVADELYSVQAVEQVVTGGIAETKAVALQLIKSAQGIMVPALQQFDKQIVAISWARTGGTSVQKQNLGNIETACDGVRDLIDKLRVLADNPDALSGCYDRAAALKENCAAVIAGESVVSLGEVPGDNMNGNGGGGRARGGRRGG